MGDDVLNLLAPVAVMTATGAGKIEDTVPEDEVDKDQMMDVKVQSQ